MLRQNPSGIIAGTIEIRGIPRVEDLGRGEQYRRQEYRKEDQI